MTIDLSGCWTKINRAREHKDSLDAIVRPVVEGKSDQIQVRAERNPRTGDYVFRVAALLEEWRLRVGVIVGDVVHNLRSALDLLFWQLYCRYIRVPRTPGERKRVQFPIEDRSQGLRNKRVHFRNIPSSYWTVIDTAQPYKRWDTYRLLGALRDLSYRDKHQVLTPVFARTTMFSLRGKPFEDTGSKEVLWVRPRRDLKIGAKVVTMRGLPDRGREVEVAGYITPHVLLPEWRRLTLNMTISRILDLVNWVVVESARLPWPVALPICHLTPPLRRIAVEGIGSKISPTVS